MMARDMVSDILPCLRTSDSGRRAVEWMQEFKVSHLPIVNETQLLGLISEEDVIDTSRPDDPIGNHSLSLQNAFVYEDQHIYDIIKTICNQKLTAIPVIGRNHEYLGCITKNDLVDYFAKVSAINESGGIIVLDVAMKDYDLSQVTRIVESNDAKILSVYTKSSPDSERLQVTLKVNKGDLKRILASFERFNYTVSASFYERTELEDVKERFDSFLRYLNT